MTILTIWIIWVTTCTPDHCSETALSLAYETRAACENVRKLLPVTEAEKTECRDLMLLSLEDL